MRKLTKLGVVVMAVVSMVSASAEDRQAVTSIKPLLIAAIDQGEAHGVYVGAGQKLMQTLFRTAEPMQIDVRSVGDLPKPGCKRLEVTSTQRGVYADEHALKLMTPKEREETKNGAEPRDVSFRYQINFCRDGRMAGN